MAHGARASMLALWNAFWRAWNGFRCLGAKNGIVLVGATDADVSTAIGVIEVLGFLEDDAEVDVACVSSQLSIDDVRRDNISFEDKARNKAHQRLGRNLIGDVADEEIVYLGTTRRHASTKRCSYREAPDAHSARKPSRNGTEPGLSSILQVMECGTLISADYSLGALAYKPRIHL